MESPVLDEDFSSVSPANHDACQVNSRNVALQRLGIKRRLARYGVEMHSQALDKGEIRMVTGQREDLLCGKPLFTSGVTHDYFLRSNFLHVRFKHRLDLPRFDPVLDIRLYPILDRLAQV